MKNNEDLIPKNDDLTSLVTVINKLNAKGYGNEFRMDEKGFLCETHNKYYNPEELEIIKTYRFEGDSDPGDNSILYVLRDKLSGLIGYCIDIYGAYTNSSRLEEIIKKIEVHREEVELFDEETGTMAS